MTKNSTTKVFINGFGRIGRLIARRILFDGPKSDIEIVGINDLVEDVGILAHLLRYDSTHGSLERAMPFSGVRAENDKIVTSEGEPWPVYHEKNPRNLPLKDVDVVVEATGAFTKREDLTKHLKAGARYVLLTAPALTGSDVDCTIVLGVNEEMFDPKKHRIISNASCTTNCLAPVAKVLHENFGIEWGLMSTVHAYTNDQRVQDLAHKDLRRARAAALNIIPTSTGAARAIGLVIPELAGRLDGMSLRVPVEDGSVVYLVVYLARDVTQEELVHAFRRASFLGRDGRLFYSLLLTERPLVSRDIIGTQYSSIVDADYVKMLGPRMAQVLAWYDNEWAYSCRVVDLIRYIGEKTKQRKEL